jgi:hypothetical protein
MRKLGWRVWKERMGLFEPGMVVNPHLVEIGYNPISLSLPFTNPRE